MIFFQLIILLFSVMIHEVSHGTMAKELGDDTAEKMGRLTLNPLAHLDFFGSFLMPLLLYFATGGKFVFGWAKPVPYNPLNLKHPRRDTALLAFAGPMANLLLALVLGVIIRLNFLPENLVYYLAYIVLINIGLAIFNLVPLPPLDGSKILLYFFPSQKLEIFLLQYGNLLLILFLIFGWGLIQPLISILFRLFIGLV
ncbi:MAG TPA: site-2 protease family protein [Candidatus Paceibacterota bacterium]|nr:site-2 protease family protein [Candidatus Paceibacterota bacterium]HRR45891.1 site-2 protease family protein [Candidatus Paceibacterota bacterium]